MKRRVRRSVFWICAGAAAFGLHRLLGKDSEVAEIVYGRGIFAGFRWIWDYTLGLSPVPLLDLFLAAALLLLVGRRLRRKAVPRPKPDRRFWRKLPSLGLDATAWAGGLVVFFYLLWGYNYNRPGIEKRLSMEAGALESSVVAAETEWAVRAAADSRAKIPRAISDSALAPDLLPPGLESEIRAGLTRALRDLAYPSPGRVRVRRFIPGGWMMRFSGSGIYLPYFGESYVSANLTPAEIPFTMAHEMAHGYGITAEGEANFFALLACETSAVPAVRYSGFLSYWITAAGELGRTDREAAKDLGGLIPEGMRADLTAIRKNWQKREGPLADVSAKVYEKYLKSQGVKEGIKS